MPGGPLVALSHYRPQGGGGGVEDVDLILLHDIPEAVGVGVGGHTLENQAGGAQSQRPVDDIAVTGDPADIGGAPEGVFFSNIEYPLEGLVAKKEIAGLSMQHPLGFAGAAAGVEDVEGVFGIHRLGLAIGLDIFRRYLFMPPVVAASFHIYPDVGSPDDNHVFYVRACLGGDIGVVLTPDNTAATVVAVGTDKKFRTAVQNSIPQRLGAETAEDNAMDSPDSGAGQHGNG